MKLNNFIHDNSGKSLALFSKKKFIFNKNLVKELKQFYNKKKKEIRICMHSSKIKSSSNGKPNNLKKNYQVHYHKYSSEYYFPLW